MKLFAILLAGSIQCIHIQPPVILTEHQKSVVSRLNDELDQIEVDVTQASTLFRNHGEKKEILALLQKGEDEIEKLTDEVMDNLDAPENDTWMRSIINRVKGTIKWHKQIDDLAEELGTEITEDPEHLKKLDKIGAMNKDFDIYS